MSSPLSVFAHAGKMRNDDSTKLTILDLLAGLVYRFDQNVPLGHVIVPGNISAGDGKQAEFRGAVEIADGLNSLLARHCHRLSAEGSAGANPPQHSMAGY